MARPKAVLESVPAPPNGRAPKQKKPRRSRVTTPREIYERRYVQTVRKVDLWSVLKVSICFYLCALIVMLLAAVFLWSIASASGLIGNVEKFVGDLMSNKDFRFLSWQVLRATTLVGLVMVCLCTVVTVLAAAFYNLFAELLGGIEITVIEQEELK